MIDWGLTALSAQQGIIWCL